MLAFLSLLWGSSFLLIKIASRAFDPFAFAFGRMGIGAAVLASIALFARWPWPREPRVWRWLIAMSLLGQVAPFLLLGAAARLTTSADLALMMGAAPICTILISRALNLGEVWNARAALGLLLGLAGVAISIGSPVAADLYPNAGWGRALGLLSAIGYAAGALMSRFASREIGPTMAATASMSASAALLGLLWLGVDGIPKVSGFAEIPAESIEALIALGCINTALAYLVYFRLAILAGATFAALNNYIVPFIGLWLGASLLAEPVALASWLGLAFVIAGVVLTGGATLAPKAAAVRLPQR